jgi:hypothetical protein
MKSRLTLVPERFNWNPLSIKELLAVMLYEGIDGRTIADPYTAHPPIIGPSDPINMDYRVLISIGNGCRCAVNPAVASGQKA